jgi:glucose/arabinose dehydrogenase
LTVGDFNNPFLTVENFQKDNQSKRLNMDLCKVMVRYKGAHQFVVFSSGHRNGQGLFWDKDTKMLFETEHGPRGGDEINVILKNKDYGWPHVTYGIDYGMEKEGKIFSNKGGVYFGNHEGYEKPIFAFVPSIGIKAITKIPVTSYEFPNWLGNYLIASLTALYRVEIDRNRVVFVEPISQLWGFRDIIVSETGIIIGSNFANELVVIKRKKGARG